MGKKSSFKKIRRLASAMPEIMAKRVEVQKKHGYQLIEEGTTECADGSKISPGKEYREKSFVGKPLNHNRMMKEIYKKDGMQGVANYMLEVDNHVTKVAAQNQANEHSAK